MIFDFEPAAIADAVLAQAVLDRHLGMTGATLSGNPFPGAWRRRHGAERERMHQLRKDAEAFFFASSHDDIRRFWFRLAGFKRPPVGRYMRSWLAHEIDHRHPRESYELWDGDDDGD